MASAPKLTATTPHGVFSRRSYHRYSWVGLRKVYVNTPAEKIVAHWSESYQGAHKLASQYEKYGSPSLGAFPVDAE